MVAEPWPRPSQSTGSGSAAPAPASGAESPGNLGRPAGAGAAAGPAGPSAGSGDEWKLVEVHQGWRRVARQLRKLFRLRRTWAALGQHLKDFTKLRANRR